MQLRICIKNFGVIHCPGIWHFLLLKDSCWYSQAQVYIWGKLFFYKFKLALYSSLQVHIIYTTAQHSHACGSKHVTTPIIFCSYFIKQHLSIKQLLMLTGSKYNSALVTLGIMLQLFQQFWLDVSHNYVLEVPEKLRMPHMKVDNSNHQTAL